MRRRRRIGRITTISAVMVLAGGLAMPGVEAGDPSTVLIYGPTLQSSTPNEASLAVDAGYEVQVATEGEWTEMTTADFAAFDVIVFADPGSSNVGLLQTAVNNRPVWSQAVTGSISVIGVDNVGHREDEGALDLTRNAILFGDAGAGTGLSVSLSYYYYASASGTPVSLLDEFGTFEVEGENSDDVDIVDVDHPLVDGIDEADLSDWRYSIHEHFTAFPADFDPVANSASTDQAYIIAGSGGDRPPRFDHPPTPACDSTIPVAPFQQAGFEVQGSDGDGDQTVRLSVDAIPAGAELTPDLPETGNPVATTFAWMPEPEDEGLHTMTFVLEDRKARTVTCSITVEVRQGTISGHGHAHTDTSGDGQSGPGDIHVRVKVLAEDGQVLGLPRPRTGPVTYRDQRPDPPGSATRAFTCYDATVESITSIGPGQIRIEGDIVCRHLAATSFDLEVTDNGVNPPNMDGYHMRLFDSVGTEVYNWEDVTSAEHGDLIVVQEA